MELKRTVKVTADGSKTLYINDLNESYHSAHGALQEARHVFIENGIKKQNFSEINILELGFGTGLNALVTFDEFLQNQNLKKVHYFTLEKYAVTSSEIENLDYAFGFCEEAKTVYRKMHDASWNKKTEIYSDFWFQKFHTDFFNLEKLDIPPVQLVFFDCFGARVQPELWERPLLEMVAARMAQGGTLTTYSSKGSVRRILKELGFTVQKLLGPPGKREMINAIKK